MKDETDGRLLRLGLAGTLALLILLLVNSVSSFLAHASQTEEISGWNPVVTDDYTVDWRASNSEIMAVFSYVYRGKTYEARGFSPFAELNEAAGEDLELIQRLIRKDHPALTVYVNPEDPEVASIASGWSRFGYFNDLNGVVLLALSLVGLYFCLRPRLRVRDLISEP